MIDHIDNLTWTEQAAVEASIEQGLAEAIGIISNQPPRAERVLEFCQ